MIQFIKFACIGGLNTALDFAVLNALIFLFTTGANGELYVFFKAFSFVVAVINSYFMNKYWVFSQRNAAEVREPLLFFTVSVIGLLLNVSISAGIFAASISLYDITPHLAANIGALTGSAAVFMWNFAGYKFVVFKKNGNGDINKKG